MQTRSSLSRLRLRITAAAETSLRRGHPWLFSDSVREQNREGQLGELAVIYDRRDRFLSIGLFDPDSPLRVRVLHAGQPVTLDDAWWKTRLKAAIERRSSLFNDTTTGFRWINGESDGWPGLVLDRYDTTLVLKLYTAAWLPRLEFVLALIARELSPDRVVLRLSRNIQHLAALKFLRRDGSVVQGAPIATPIGFREKGLKFEADVLRGQKTGFFLDQRDNRRSVELLAHGQNVLNTFSFSGGFSLYAARGGAKSVTDLDLSAHALAASQRNFGLNRDLPTVVNCRHETIQADAFEWLNQKPKHRFGLVILDPPSLAKRESERAGAKQAYARLASAGLRQLTAHGILVAASCSAHVSAEEFFEAALSSARATGQQFEVLQQTRHPADHPATFAEAEYLKAIFLRF